MGINIGLVLSEHIPEQKWHSVYDESLALAQKLGLADLTLQIIHGHAVQCLTITQESEEYGRIGWRAVADYVDRDGAEWFYTYRDLHRRNGDGQNGYREYHDDQHLGDKSGDQQHGDPYNHDILYEYAYYVVDLPGMEEPKGTFREMWGAKTQGKSYHMSLLAIGCLIQDRLGDDAMVRGDYTAGQCRVAVEMANRFLDNPIRVPCRCEPDRWLKRIERTNAREEHKIRIAIGMYHGRLDADFGERMREAYSHEALCEYWKSKFGYYSMSQFGFSNSLHEYLTMGFSVSDLFDLVSFTDKEGNDQHEKFIKHILDAKLHWKEVDTTDIMVQDPDDPTLYGIEAMMVRGLSMGARNKKIDRYIPIDELRGILKRKMSGYGDVDVIIDQYLAREKELENADTTEERLERDCSAEINRIMNARKDAFDELQNEYPVYREEMLVDYEPGDGITPAIEMLLAKIMKFAATIPLSDLKTVDQKEEWLAENYDHIPPFKDTDWKHIFSAIEDDPDSFRRYYPFFRIDLSQRIVQQAVVALILNDDLYEHALTLSYDELVESEES